MMKNGAATDQVEAVRFERKRLGVPFEKIDAIKLIVSRSLPGLLDSDVRKIDSSHVGPPPSEREGRTSGPAPIFEHILIFTFVLYELAVIDEPSRDRVVLGNAFPFDPLSTKARVVIISLPL